jgi:hypothetical protein
MTRRIILSIVFAACLGLAAGMPYYMLTSSVSKCFQVDVPPQTTITIAYHAPDLDTGDDDPPDAKPRSTARHMNIVVSQPTAAADDKASRQRREASATTQLASGRIREQLSKRTGSIEYTTAAAASEGLVEICAQALSASKRVPVRIALRVFQDTKAVTGRKLVLQKLAQGQVIRSGAETLLEQSSRLTDELLSLSSRVHDISESADYMKEKERSFQDKTVSLQQAVKYWPMFRIFVLVSAAYLQTHYVVSFMKRRHIL